MSLNMKCPEYFKIWVNRVRPAVSGMPCINSGIQKWNRESPDFMTKIIVMMVDTVGLKIFVSVHCLEYIKLAIIAIIGSIYVVACVRKYLVDTSIACGLFF